VLFVKCEKCGSEYLVAGRLKTGAYQTEVVFVPMTSAYAKRTPALGGRKDISIIDALACKNCGAVSNLRLNNINIIR